MIFVNSMSDLFHKNVPTAFIDSVFFIMNSEERHCFQVLTKRSGRLLQLSGRFNWTTNIWMGVSIESEEYLHRIDGLWRVTASVRFLSLEPLLEPLPDLDLAGIDWVIVGGESGPGARKMKKEWVEDIHNQCQLAEVPFFFKQWGGANKKKTGRKINNHTWDEMPSTGSRIGI
jgi:protein gp37